MKRAFRATRFTAASTLTIERANEVIEAYQAEGLRLTLRQLYYQFVSRDWLANTDKNYKALGRVISDARLAGLVDWNAIEDRGRVPSVPHHEVSMSSFLDSMRDMAQAYSLDPWQGQKKYVELWVEKDALSGVLRPIAEEFSIALSVNKGYSSQSAMYAAAERFIEFEPRDGVILYVGDFDPSGEDMVRDIRERLALFRADVEVRKIALTIEQIRQYRPPPNPAKVNDPRAAKYIEEHGDRSWEVDALEPRVLRTVITRELRELIEPKKMKAVEARVEMERATIEEALSEIRT